jgi:hypothetical protein
MRTGDQDSASGNASDVGSRPHRRQTSQTTREIYPLAELRGVPFRSTVGRIMHLRPVLAVLLVALTSCNKYMDWYSCINPDRGHRDALNNPDPCHENDPDAGNASVDAGEGCDGVCLPGIPNGWDGPDLLWTGDEADAPQCSDYPGTPHEVYSGHGELDAQRTATRARALRRPDRASCRRR